MELFEFNKQLLDVVQHDFKLGFKPIRMSFEGETYDIGDVFWDPNLEIFIITRA